MKKIIVICVILILTFCGGAFGGDALVSARYADVGVRKITGDELEQLQKNEKFSGLKKFGLPEEEIPDKKEEIKTQLQEILNMFEQMTGMTIRATVGFLPPLLAEFDDNVEGYEEETQSFAVAITGAELRSKMGISSIIDPRVNNFLGFQVYEYDEGFEGEYEYGGDDIFEGEVYSELVDKDGNSMHGKQIDSSSTYYIIVPLYPDDDDDEVVVHAALINLTRRDGNGSGGCDTGAAIFAAVALCGFTIRARAKRRPAESKGGLR